MKDISRRMIDYRIALSEKGYVISTPSWNRTFNRLSEGSHLTFTGADDSVTVHVDLSHETGLVWDYGPFTGDDLSALMDVLP